MAIKLENLNSTEQHLVDVTTTQLHEINGGAVAFVTGATGTTIQAAFDGFTKNPSAGTNLAQNVAKTVAFTGIGAAFGGPKGASLSGD
jgi:hypothetical protein